jgi:hypothetical protein
MPPADLSFTPPENLEAAKKGCGGCGGPVRIPPAGDPFSDGPQKGRYRCAECWTLWWDEHPGDLVDEETREYVAAEASKIRIRRAHEARIKERHGMTLGQAEILFEDGESRVFLTERGTLLFSIDCPEHFSPDEFDPDRLRTLARALAVVHQKFPDFGLARVGAE